MVDAGSRGFDSLQYTAVVVVGFFGSIDREPDRAWPEVIQRDHAGGIKLGDMPRDDGPILFELAMVNQMA